MPAAVISPLHHSSHQLLHATQRYRVALSETGNHFSCTDQTEQRSHDTIIIVLLLVVLYRDVIVMFTNTTAVLLFTTHKELNDTILVMFV